MERTEWAVGRREQGPRSMAWSRRGWSATPLPSAPSRCHVAPLLRETASILLVLRAKAKAAGLTAMMGNRAFLARWPRKRSAAPPLDKRRLRLVHLQPPIVRKLGAWADTVAGRLRWRLVAVLFLYVCKTCWRHNFDSDAPRGEFKIWKTYIQNLKR